MKAIFIVYALLLLAVSLSSFASIKRHPLVQTCLEAGVKKLIDQAGDLGRFINDTKVLECGMENNPKGRSYVWFCTTLHDQQGVAMNLSAVTYKPAHRNCF